MTTLNDDRTECNIADMSKLKADADESGNENEHESEKTPDQKHLRRKISAEMGSTEFFVSNMFTPAGNFIQFTGSSRLLKL